MACGIQSQPPECINLFSKAKIKLASFLSFSVLRFSTCENTPCEETEWVADKKEKKSRLHALQVRPACAIHLLDVTLFHKSFLPGFP